MSDWDRFPEECGVVGYFPRQSALFSSHICCLALYALQHRGQEACGISVAIGDDIVSHRGVGLVSSVFDEDILSRKLQGEAAIGHVRYSTFGSSSLRNAQPLVVTCRFGKVAIAHNGNLVNAKELRQSLELDGAIFQSEIDTEVFCHLISRSRESDFLDALKEACQKVRGAYSLTILRNNVLYALRDPNGFRPLVLGKLGFSTVVASETCAFDLLGAKFVREINPGELVEINHSGESGFQLLSQATRTPCIFELIYFSRPDSIVFGKSSYSARFRMGEILWKESPADADIIVPVPDSGVVAALGMSHASGLEFVMGLTRNHYIGRTFISPGQEDREFKLRLKLNVVSEKIRGMRVILVDDSIVRGTTCDMIASMLKKAGAAEVHMRVSSPPIHNPCFFGIDTPNKDQLIAANMSIKAMRERFGVDSLEYLSMDGVMEAVSSSSYCRACFDGDYPVDLK